MILLLFLLSTLTFTISRVQPTHIEILPTVTLNCTTDYATQIRSIHVIWFLNSTVPSDTDRVLTCNSSINCGNGSHTPKDSNCRRRYGWNYTSVPLDVQFCNVSVSYVDDEGHDYYYVTNYTTCLFSDIINTTVNIRGAVENLTVGDPHAIQCEVHTDKRVLLNITNITWTGPNNNTIVNNSRMSVTTSNSVGHNHTSTLYFSYLSEGDEGSYTCRVAIHGNKNFTSFKLSVLIPTPTVNVAILSNDNKTVGTELSLGCNVTIASGVTSSLEFVWMKNGIPVEEINDDRMKTHNGTINSSLQFSYLSEDDEGLYTCNVTLRDAGASDVFSLDKFDVPCPKINVTAINQDVGSRLSLRCVVDTVRGFTSDLDIMWLTDGEEIANYIDPENMTENKILYYNGSRGLTLDDNNTVYQCRVLFNNMSLYDNLTLNVIGKVRAPSSSQDTSPNATVISMISLGIVIAILVFIVFIGLYVYLTKRNKVTQVRRNSDYFQPFDVDVDYSVIGKDAPSTCESLSANQKVKEWMKHTQMPTVDEECESVISTANEEEMLNFVHGYTYKEGTQMKATEFGYDSGVDSELNSGSGKTSSKQNAYISHQAVVDMCHANTNETNQPNPQDATVGFDNAHNDQLVAATQNSANSNPSQTFPNSIVKLGPSMISPVANGSYQSLYIEENHTNHNGREPLSYATNAGSAETARNGSYIDHYTSSNDDTSKPLASYPITTGTYTNAVDSHDPMSSNSHPRPIITHTDTNSMAKEWEYIDHYSGSINDNSNPLLLHSTSNDTVTATDGSYIDHYATSHGSQPFSHSTYATTATAAAEEETNYVDHYIATNDDNGKPFTNPLPLQSTDNATVMDGAYVDHYVTSNDKQPISHTTDTNTTATAEEGSYVDRYIGLNGDDKLTNAEVVEIGNSGLPYITDNQLATNVIDNSYIADDHFVTVQHGSKSDDVQQIKPEQSSLNSPLMGYTTGYIETNV